jgi:hypothetical protein
MATDFTPVGHSDKGANLVAAAAPHPTNSGKRDDDSLSAQKKPGCSNLFTNSRNGFDPSSFYGEDAEKEDDNIEDHDLSMPPQAPPMSSQPSPFRISVTSHKANPTASEPAAAAEEEYNAQLLTDQDLFEMFGVAPPRPVVPQADANEFTLPDHDDDDSSSEED